MLVSEGVIHAYADEFAIEVLSYHFQAYIKSTLSREHDSSVTILTESQVSQ
jgi:hypothetical protein